MSLQVWLPLNRDPNMTPEIASYRKESGVTLTEDTDGWYKVHDTTHGANGRWGIYYDFAVKPNTTYTLYVYSKSTTGTKASIGIQSFAVVAWPAVRDTNTASDEKLTTYSWTTGSSDSIARVYLALMTTSTKDNDYVFYKEPRIYEAPQNQGVANTNITENGAIYQSNAGKLGGCFKTTSNAHIDLKYNGDQINTGSISFGGWFNFNKNELQERFSTYTYTDIHTTPTGNIIGNNSYGGVGLIWYTNNMYNTNGILNNLYITCSIRSANNGARATSGREIPFNTWVHLFLIFNKITKELQLWINGELVQYSIMLDFDDARSQNLMLNYNAVWGGNGPSFNIPFLANDVRIYDHTLSVQEIKELSRGLVLHYPLNNNGFGNENLMPNSVDTLVGSSNYNTGTWRLAGSSQMNRSRVAISDSPIGNLAYGFQSVGLQTGPDGSCWGIDGFPRETGVTYTVSAWGRIVGGSTTAAMLGFSLYNATAVSYGGAYGKAKSSDAEYYGNGAYDYAGGRLRPDGKWTKIWRTFISTASSGNVYIGFNTAITGENVTLQLCGVKIEKGSIATPWCPNVSDTLYTKMGMNNNIVYDISGFNNNGTVTGALSTSSDTVRYKVSTYMPQSSLIKHSRTLSNVDQEWTCCAWVKLDNTSISVQSLNNFNNNNNIVHASDGVPLLYLNAGANDYYMYGSQKVNASEWTHVVFVFKNSTGLRNIYINGVLTNNYGPNKTSTPSGIPAIVTIGNNFTGYISDYREYATALSALDIAELYKMGREVN